MYSHTKKVGSMGRYGIRVGRKLRDQNLKIEEKSKNVRCPSCGKIKIKRVSKGIWECRSCKNRFSGGAFLLTRETKSVEETE
ncbi:MAG: 50S ribosomal protein L37ae [Candidatus Altiarchaeota archaeon]